MNNSDDLNQWVMSCLAFDESYFGTADDVEDLVLIGRKIFNDDDLGMKELLSELQRCLGRTFVHIADPMVAVEACLLCALSESCNDRSYFVEHIMTLDAELQTSLMSTMQANMEHHPCTVIEVNVDESNPVRCYDDVAPLQCKQCEQYASSKQTMLLLHETRQKELEENFKSELALEKNRLIDVELQVLSKDEQLAEQVELIEDYKKSINTFEEKIVVLTEEQTRLAQLEYEIDGLRAKAEKVEKSELQIEKLRDKVDELSDVKKQLKEEVENHGTHYNRLLETEEEIEKLKQLIPQVEEYRQKQAELVMEIEQLSYRLREKELKLSEFMNDQQSHIDVCVSNNLQSQLLSDELKLTADKLSAIEDSNGVTGVGTGLTELNPVLMQELDRLKREKDELLRKLDASSMDSLGKLEKDAADLKCLNASLQKKLMHTQDVLIAAEKNIELLNGMVSQLEGSLEGVKQELGASQSEAVALQAANAQLQESLSNTATELEETVCKRTAEKETYDQDRVSFEEQLKSAKVQEENNIKSLHDEYGGKLSEENQRFLLVSADVDQERMKRRRIEREKKFHESEAHRHKVLLQSSSTGAGPGNGQNGNADIGDALKEIKTMQLELDAAKLEIQTLKSNTNATVGMKHARDDTENNHNADGHGRSTKLGTRCSTRVAAGAIGASTTVPFSSSADTKPALRSMGPATNATNSVSAMSASGGVYLMEQMGIAEKKIDQLTREKRDMVAKNLEESKEKMELSQKLLMAEKEVTLLKSKVSKVSLEKERLERKILKENDNNGNVGLANQL